MKWMFKEDHSLGKHLAVGPAAGGRGGGWAPSPTGAALVRVEWGGCPAPVSSRLGPGAWGSRLLTPCHPPRALLGAVGDRTAAAGTPEPGPGLCAGRKRRRAGGRKPTGGQAQPSVLFVSPTEHRCVESAKIRAKYPDRVPVSVWTLRPLTSLSPLSSGTRNRPQAIQQLTS